MGWLKFWQLLKGPIGHFFKVGSLEPRVSTIFQCCFSVEDSGQAKIGRCASRDTEAEV
jgi:hypothetical protein